MFNNKITRRSTLTMLASVFSQIALAQVPMTGAGLPVLGGGGGYVAKAVHFDGTQVLINPALVATDNAFFSMSLWFKLASFNNGQLFTVDPLGNYTNNAYFTTGRNSLTLLLQDTSARALTSYGDPGGSLGAWHNMIFSSDTVNHIAKVYLDDVDVTNVPVAESLAAMAFNGLAFYVGDDGFGDAIVGDFADFWIAPGVSLLTAGDITVTNRRKFISASGKPVDPVGFPVTPVLFSGDATTFATNQGTGGAFMLTGSLTNATTSPSN